MKGNLLYFYPAVSLQRTRELSFFLALSLPPDLLKLYEWGWRWREGGKEGTHKHTDTHAGKNGTEKSESKRWWGGRVTARKCVKKRRRATCKARKNEKLPVAKYLAKCTHTKKSRFSPGEQKGGCCANKVQT